jgi:hypothetical protein
LREAGVDPPIADELIEDAQPASAEHVGGDQRADAHLLLDDGDRADRGHRDRAQHGQGRAEVRVAVGGRPAHDRALDALGVALLPKRAYRLVEGQRFHGRSAGDDLGDHVVATEAALALASAGVDDRATRTPGDDDECGHEEEQHEGDRLRDDERQYQEQDRERQVAQHQRRGAG